MLVDDIVKTPVSWMSRRGSGIVISSRIRIARNLKGVAFPGWAGEDECVRLCQRIKEALGAVPSLHAPLFIDMAALDDIDRLVLSERNLISLDFSEKGRGSMLVVDDARQVAIMVNEEDHIRMQAIRSGLHLKSMWNMISAIDSELDRVVDFAFSRKLGYLTACPTNVGTGLRASVMMHLSGLKLTGEVDGVLNGLNKMGFAVRGILGEGTEAYGNMFQISNQSTLGESEESIIERLMEIVREVAQHEENARIRLLEQREIYVVDQVTRAFALLMHALILTSDEAIDLLSGLRLGVEMGMVRGLSVARINEITLLNQPGHLQKLAGKVLTTDERDELRAKIVKSKLKNVKLIGRH